MTRNSFSGRFWHSSTALGLLLVATIAVAQELTNTSLTIGAIKDQAESSAVRVLAKYGDSLSINDEIVPKEITGDRGLFYTVSRQATIDTNDTGKFGGVSFRYGFKRYDVGMKIDTEAPPRADGKPVVKFDGDKWMHVFPIQIGADADRTFNNRDYLVELGYIPAQFRSGDTCFKLGANPIVGVSGQLGHRKRSAEAITPDKPAETSGPLRRMKIEGKFDFQLSCIQRMPASPDTTPSGLADMLFTDISQWQVMLSAAAWRDFVENRTYKKTELTIRIPTGTNTSMDFKREIGAAPTNFDTGAKFSANLTIAF